MSHSDSPTVVELYGRTGAIINGEISRFHKGEFKHAEIDVLSDIPHTELQRDVPIFFHEIEHFAMAIAGEAEPDVSSTDAYIFMKILDGLYDSAKTGKQVIIK